MGTGLSGEGKCLGATTTLDPYRLTLYSSIHLKAHQPTSWRWEERLPHQAPHIQVLNRNHRLGSRQLGGDLVQEVPVDVPYPPMEPSHPQGRNALWKLLEPSCFLESCLHLLLRSLILLDKCSGASTLVLSESTRKGRGAPPLLQRFVLYLHFQDTHCSSSTPRLQLLPSSTTENRPQC